MQGVVPIVPAIFILRFYFRRDPRRSDFGHARPNNCATSRLSSAGLSRMVVLGCVRDQTLIHMGGNW